MNHSRTGARARKRRGFLCLLLLTACTGTEDGKEPLRRVVTTNQYHMRIVSYYNAAGQKEGKELQFYYNGALMALQPFKAGLRDGPTVIFHHPNIFVKPLSVQKIIYFKNDKQHGKSYVFYENGHLETVQRYHRGKIVGDAYFFDDWGRLKCRETFGPGGVLVPKGRFYTLSPLSKRVAQKPA